jgi:hypothetical protein
MCCCHLILYCFLPCCQAAACPSAASVLCKGSEAVVVPVRPAAAALARLGDEDLFGHMGPVFQRLQRIMGEAEPLHRFPGPAVGLEEAAVGSGDAPEGDAALQRQEEGAGRGPMGNEGHVVLS